MLNYTLQAFYNRCIKPKRIILNVLKLHNRYFKYNPCKSIELIDQYSDRVLYRFRNASIQSMMEYIIQHHIDVVNYIPGAKFKFNKTK